MIPSNSEPENEILFEDNENGEYNPNTEVDTKVDINEPIVKRSGRGFRIQEFIINQIEDPWFDEINETYKEYSKVYTDIIAKTMCFYNDKLANMNK